MISVYNCNNVSLWKLACKIERYSPKTKQHLTMATLRDRIQGWESGDANTISTEQLIGEWLRHHVVIPEEEKTEKINLKGSRWIGGFMKMGFGCCTVFTYWGTFWQSTTSLSRRNCFYNKVITVNQVPPAYPRWLNGCFFVFLEEDALMQLYNQAPLEPVLVKL